MSSLPSKNIPCQSIYQSNIANGNALCYCFLVGFIEDIFTEILECHLTVSLNDRTKLISRLPPLISAVSNETVVF